MSLSPAKKKKKTASLRTIFLLFFPLSQEWELLVLYKLGWEMTAVTPLDYLDHALPRLCLEDDSLLSLSAEEARDLRERTEAALVLAATRYQFSYVSPSTLAAAAALASLEWVRPALVRGEAAMREVRLRLQAVTHTSNVSENSSPIESE